MGDDEISEYGQVRCGNCEPWESDTTWTLVDESDDRRVYLIRCEKCAETANLIEERGDDGELTLYGDVEPVKGIVATRADVGR